MIEVTLYGDVKKIVVENNPDAKSIMLYEYVEGENFQDFLRRLGLDLEVVGDCYINNALAEPDYVLRDRDTIELNQRTN
jgi:hypothetical protein